MADLINLFIDDVAIAVPKGTLIVDAAKQAGINIPVFCYHPKLEPVGMCRMCLVEVGTPQVDRATGQPVLDANGQPVIALDAETADGLHHARERGHGRPHETRKWSRTRSARCWNSCSPATRSIARSATRAASARCKT